MIEVKVRDSLTMTKRLLSSSEERANFRVHRTRKDEVLASMTVIADEEGEEVGEVEAEKGIVAVEP